jgi:hypothetical protein
VRSPAADRSTPRALGALLLAASRVATRPSDRIDWTRRWRNAMSELRAKRLGVRGRAIALLVALVGAASLRVDKRSRRSPFRWEAF